MATTVRIVPQGEIAKGTAEAPALQLPNRVTFFARRAERLRALAARSSDGAYLRLMAGLASAQHAALAAHPKAAPPSQEHLQRCREHGMPPLARETLGLGKWGAALRSILSAVPPDAPAALHAVALRLGAADPARLETLAGDVLDFDYPNLDPAEVPLVAAALQVDWIARAGALGAAAFQKLDIPNVCPVCGSPALASVIQGSGPAPGSRYAQCSLCHAEWHLLRGRCTACDSSKEIAYFHIDGEADVVKAEACDECHSYLKIVNLERDGAADAAADDLATLALDVLMDESGYQRSGPNLLFVPGQT